MSDQTPQEGELILNRTADDVVRVEVLYESETFWLDQRHTPDLFDISVRRGQPPPDGGKRFAAADAGRNSPKFLETT